MSTNSDLNQINEIENEASENLNNEITIRNEPDIQNNILGESSVDKQFREFENTLTDPYESIKVFAQSQREKFNNGYEEQNLNHNSLNTNPDIRLSDRANSLFNYAALSVKESSLTIIRRQELTSLNQGHHLIGYESKEPGSLYKSLQSNDNEIVTGLINRPGVAEYNNLFSDSYGTLNASFFQLQNKEVVSELLQRQNETKLVTQGLIPSSSGNSNQILANNEITAKLSNGTNLSITRAYSDTESSIHPKMGYNDKYAFIGTQNITSALNKYNTQENLLIVKRTEGNELVTAYSGFKEITVILSKNISLSKNAVFRLNKQTIGQANSFAENIIANQIIVAQNSLLSTIEDDPNSIVRPKEFANKLTENLNILNTNNGADLGTYVFTSSEIFNRLKEVINTASNLSTTDRVVISGKELNILFNKTSDKNFTPEVYNFRQDILKLANQGRLTIVTDNNYLNKLHYQNNNPDNINNGLDETGVHILNELTRRNQIKAVSVGVNHEKTTMVFGGGIDDKGVLKFISTGSANYSVGAMLDDNKNTELIVAVGIDGYQHDSKSVVERTVAFSLLTNLNRETDNETSLYSRYETLSGLDFSTGKSTHSSIRNIEKNADSLGVNKLKIEVLKLNKRLGGNLIQVFDRFSNEGKLIGIKAVLQPLDNVVNNKIIINLSVNREQNVVLSDLNKVISGSAFVNMGTRDKTINGRTIKAGETAQMSSTETAVGVLATITREISHQSRYQLVDRTFHTLSTTGYIDTLSTTTTYVRLLVPDLVQDAGQGDLTLATVIDAVNKKYENNPNQLKKDIHEVSLKLAGGITSPFNQIDKGFKAELKADKSKIATRYSVISSLITDSINSNYDDDSGFYRFINALENDPNRTFADFRLQSILSSKEGRRRFSKAFNSLGSSLINLISSPFLALHEQTYGAYQAQARTPIYGEGDISQDDNILNRLINEGFLNPKTLGHSDKLGEAGDFYRAINHTASADNLKLPAYGGLNQVKLTDSDLHEGAVAVYNNKTLFSSLNNHGFIIKEEYKQKLESILDEEVDEDKLNTIFGVHKIIFSYAFPESKLEQLQQRIKNTTGARVGLDINTKVLVDLQNVRKTDTDKLIREGNLLTGEIKASLPRAQGEQVKAYIKSFTEANNRPPTLIEITEYFRELELDRSLTKRGVIGEEKYKRVVINAGFSNMGDYMYGNPNDAPTTGYIRNISLKINIQNINNIEDTKGKLIKAFAQDNVIYNEPVKITNVTTLQLKTLANEIDYLSRDILEAETNSNEIQEIKAKLEQISIKHQEVYSKLQEIKTNVDLYLSDKPQLRTLLEEQQAISKELYDIKTEAFSKENKKNLTSSQRKENRLIKGLFLIIDASFKNFQDKEQFLSNADVQFSRRVRTRNDIKHERFELTTNVNVQEYVNQKALLTKAFTEIKTFREENYHYDFLLTTKDAAYERKATFMEALLKDPATKNIQEMLVSLEAINKDIYSKTEEIEAYRVGKPDLFLLLDNLEENKSNKYKLKESEKGKPNSLLTQYINLTDQISDKYNEIDRLEKRGFKPDVFKVLNEKKELKDRNRFLLESAADTDLLSLYKIATDEVAESFNLLKELRTQYGEIFSLKDNIAKYTSIKSDLVNKVKGDPTHILTRYISNQDTFNSIKAELEKFKTSHANIFAILEREAKLKKDRYALIESDNYAKEYNELNKTLFEINKRFDGYRDTNEDLVTLLDREKEIKQEKFKLNESDPIAKTYSNLNKTLFEINKRLEGYEKDNVNADVLSLLETERSLKQQKFDLVKRDSIVAEYARLNKVLYQIEERFNKYRETHESLLNAFDREKVINTEKYAFLKEQSTPGSNLENYIKIAQNIFDKRVELNKVLESNEFLADLLTNIDMVREGIRNIQNEAPQGYLDEYNKTSNEITQQFRLLEPLKSEFSDLFKVIQRGKDVDYAIKALAKKDNRLINLYEETKIEKRLIKTELEKYKVTHKKIFEAGTRITKLYKKNIQIKDRQNKLGYTLINEYDQINYELFKHHKKLKKTKSDYLGLSTLEREDTNEEYTKKTKLIQSTIDNLQLIKQGLVKNADANKSGLTNYIKIKDIIKREKSKLEDQRTYTKNTEVFKLLDRLDQILNIERAVKSVFSVFRKDTYTQDELYITKEDQYVNAEKRSEINDAIFFSDTEENKAYANLIQESYEISKVLGVAKLDKKNKRLFQIQDKITELFKFRHSLISKEKNEGLVTFLQDYAAAKSQLSAFNKQLKEEFARDVNSTIKVVYDSLTDLITNRKEIFKLDKLVMLTNNKTVIDTYRDIQNRLKEVKKEIKVFREDLTNDTIFEDQELRKTIKAQRNELEKLSKDLGLKGIETFKGIKASITNIQKLIEESRLNPLNAPLFNDLDLKDETVKAKRELEKISKEYGLKGITKLKALKAELKAVTKQIKQSKLNPLNAPVFKDLDLLAKTLQAKKDIEKTVQTLGLDSIEVFKAFKDSLTLVGNELKEARKDKNNAGVFALIDRLKESNIIYNNIQKEAGDKVWKTFKNVVTRLKNLHTKLDVYKLPENQHVFDAVDDKKAKESRKSNLEQQAKDTNNLDTLEYIENKKNIKLLNQQIEVFKTDSSNDALFKLFDDKKDLLEQRKLLIANQDDSDRSIDEYLKIQNEINSINERIGIYKNAPGYDEVFSLLEQKSVLKEQKYTIIDNIIATNAGIYEEYKLLNETIKTANNELAAHPLTQRYNELVEQKQSIHDNIQKITDINDIDVNRYIELSTEIKTIGEYLKTEFPDLLNDFEILEDKQRNLNKAREKITSEGTKNPTLLKTIIAKIRKKEIKTELQANYANELKEIEKLEANKGTLRAELNDLITQSKSLAASKRGAYNTLTVERHKLAVLQNEFNKQLKSNNLVLINENNENNFYLDKGLYSFDETGKPIQLGRFDREGIITLNNINISDGEGRHTAISFKVGSSKDKGYSIFVGQPSIIAANDKTVVSIQAAELVVNNHQSGGRLVGVKGPVLYMDGSLFTNIGDYLKERDNELRKSSRLSLNIKVSQEIYTINTFSQFKDFSFESGLVLLRDQGIRDSLTGRSQDRNIDGYQLAESLALLFLDKDKDSEIRTVLKEHLKDTDRSQVAQVIDNIKGKDFSEVVDSKSKYNLGVIANGLTMLADPVKPSYKDNVIEGNLTGVKQLVIEALKKGPEGDKARETLLKQTTKLIDLARNETNSIWSGPEFVSFEDQSSVTKGAGMLAHVTFIASQLLNNPFTKGKSKLKQNLYEIKVNDVNRYLNDEVYKQKVDYIASTAGLSLTEFNKQNKDEIDKGKLQDKLNFLDRQFNSGVLIEDIKSITTSSSLVAAGVNNETAFEYQNLAGASISYLNRYRRNNKIREEGSLIRTKESQTIRTAYSIILTASLNSDQLDESNTTIPSEDPKDLISYRSILLKPASVNNDRSWHNAVAENVNSLITNFTPIANKIGLLSESIAKDNIDEYKAVGKINTMTVGKNNDPAVINRAISISEVTSKFTYYSKTDGDFSVIKQQNLQNDNLYKSLVDKSIKRESSSLDLVTKIIADKYTKYLNKIEEINKKRDTVPDIVLDSFSKFVEKEGTIFDNDVYNDQILNTIKELENNEGKLRNITGEEDLRKERIKLSLSENNDRSQKLVEDSLYIDRVGRAKQYIDATLSLHNELQTKLDNSTSTVEKQGITEYLNEVSKTKNLVLPSFQAMAQEDGSFRLQFYNLDMMSPHQGTILGSDVIGKVPLVFPGHVEDVLINQINLRKQVETVQPILKNIQQAVNNKSAISLSGAELEQLNILTDLMNQSVEGIKSLANTSFSQKVYGEGETFYGNNTIPVNSLAISANEAVVGDKINNLTSGYVVKEVIESYFESIKNISKSTLNDNDKYAAQVEEINRLKLLYENLGAKGDTLEQAVTYEKELNNLYTEIDNKSNPLNSNDIDNLRQRYTEAVTGLPFDVITSATPDDINKYYNIREVAARRGGAPAGIAAMLADTFFNKTLSVTTYNRNISSIGSELSVDVGKSYTAVILPTLSHLIAQQGDYDGDSFQLLMSNSGENTQELLNIKNKQRILLNKITTRENIVADRRNVLGQMQYESSTQSILDDISLLRDELEEEKVKEGEYLNLLTKTLTAEQVVKTSELFQMKKFTAFNQAIPIGALDGLSAGTVIAFSKFARTLIGNVEDSSEYALDAFERYEKQYEAFTNLQNLYGTSFDINEDHTSISKLEEHKRNLLNTYNLDVSTKDIEQAFTAIKSVNPDNLDSDSVRQSLISYHAAQSSMSQAFDAYIKHNEKAAGTLLNPDQIDLMQSLIGQAGTDLLGKSYNTIIPLLDQAMSDKGLQDILTISLSKDSFKDDFNKTLYANAAQAGMSQVEADNLVNKIHSDENINKVNTRAEATFAFLGSMQQVIRDALKDRSDRGLKSQLTTILETEYEEGKTVGSILKETSGESTYEEISKTRNLLFKNYVGSKLGSDLNINIPDSTPDSIKSLFAEARGNYVDASVTGFGALLMLRELALTETEDDFKTRFIDNNDSLKESFNKKLQSGEVSSAQEFATQHVLNLLERTQASFADVMLAEPQRKEKVNALIEYGRKFNQQQIDTITNVHSKAGLQLMKDYGEFTETDEYKNLSQKDKDRLNSQFSTDVSLHTIREREGLTLKDMYHLQASARETQRIKNYQQASSGDDNVNTSGSPFDPSILMSSNVNQEASAASIGTIQRMLRRGHISADQAQSLFRDKLVNIESAIGQNPDLTQQEQQQTALMLGFNTRADLEENERKVLAKTLAQVTPTLKQNSQSIQALYSTSEQFDTISQAINLATTDKEKAELEVRRDHYKHLMNQYASEISIDKVQSTNDVNQVAAPPPGSPPDTSQTPHTLESILNEITNQSQITENLLKIDGPAKPRGIILRHDPNFANLGALAVPLFLGAVAQGVKLDERALIFGYDVLQSTAHLATKQERLITKIGELTSPEIMKRSSDTAANFQKSRITQNLQVEGAVIGGLQSIAQEAMFMALSDVAYKGVDKVLAKGGFENMKIGRGLAVIAAEVLTTVAAMSISRALTKQRTNDGEYIPDFIGRMLQDFSEQIWLATQESLLNQSILEYEVIDTDENMNADSTVSGLLNQNELDSITEFVKIDDDANNIDDLSSSIPSVRSTNTNS